MLTWTAKSIRNKRSICCIDHISRFARQSGVQQTATWLHKQSLVSCCLRWHRPNLITSQLSNKRVYITYISYIISAYCCEYYNPVAIDRLLGPPMATIPVQPRFIGKLGEAIRFICPIRADPPPMFEWYRVSEQQLGISLSIRTAAPHNFIHADKEFSFISNTNGCCLFHY